MKAQSYFFLFLLFIHPLTLSADKEDNKSLLKELDRVIKHKIEYQSQKEKSINSLKAQLLQANKNEEKYDLCGSLFIAYLHYQADSALHYINKKAEIAPMLNRPNLECEIFINRAEVMGVMGMYVDALNQLKQVDPQKLDKALLEYYYRTYRACYGWIADYTTYKAEKLKYVQLTDLYRDSIMLTMDRA